MKSSSPRSTPCASRSPKTSKKPVDTSTCSIYEVRSTIYEVKRMRRARNQQSKINRGGLCYFLLRTSYFVLCFSFRRQFFASCLWQQRDGNDHDEICAQRE